MESFWSSSSNKAKLQQLLTEQILVLSPTNGKVVETVVSGVCRDCPLASQSVGVVSQGEADEHM